MIAVKNWKSYYEDNLVLRVLTHDKKMFSQGKRLPKGASDQLKRIQKVYVKEGTVSAIRILREENSLSIHDSLKTFNVLRGKEQHSWVHLT